MGRIVRYEQCGAVFSEDFRRLSDLRKRGTISGTLTNGENARGRYTSFPGSDDYWTVNQEAAVRFDSGAQDFTITLWMQTTTASFMMLLDKSDAGNDGWSIYIDALGNAYGSLNASAAFYPDGVVDGDWHMLAFVVDRSASLTMYVDGVAGTPVAIAGPAMATTTRMRFGCRSFDTSLDYTGDMKDCVIFDRVLSTDELLSMYDGSVFRYWEREVSYWDMSDINPPDLGFMGNGNDGTGTGLVAATDIVDGPKHDKAIEFNGTNELVDFGSDTSLDLTGEISLVIVTALNAFAGAGVFMSRRAGAEPGGWAWREDAVAGEFELVWYDTGGTQRVWTSGTAGLVIGTWYMLGCSFDGDTCNLYVNGESVTVTDPGDFGPFFSAVGQPLRIGQRVGGGATEWLSGKVAYAAMYAAFLNSLQHRDFFERWMRSLS